MPKGPDMGQLMKQVQQMQAEMSKAQEQLKTETVEASAGGGMVKVKMSGDLRLLEIAIDPEAIDPEDPELLQDMVLAAVNEAIRSAQELAASRLGGISGLGAGSWSAIIALVMPYFGRLFDQHRYDTAFALATCFPIVGFAAWWVLSREPRVASAPS